MEYRALKSFCGEVCMFSGEVRELEGEDTARDLLKAGYIEPVQPSKDTAKKPVMGKEKASEDK